MKNKSYLSAPGPSFGGYGNNPDGRKLPPAQTAVMVIDVEHNSDFIDKYQTASGVSVCPGEEPGIHFIDVLL